MRAWSFHINYDSYIKDNDEVGYRHTIICKDGKSAQKVLADLRQCNINPVVKIVRK